MIAVAVARVDACRPAIRQLTARADHVLLDLRMLDSGLPPLAGRRRIRLKADLVAVRIEIHIELLHEIAIP